MAKRISRTRRNPRKLKRMRKIRKTAFTKIDGFNQELHSINTELKEMAEHNAA